jgi:hypothetical protein
MKFNFCNYAEKPVAVGVEPWGWFETLQPNETVELEIDELETVTYDDGNEGNSGGVISFYAKRSAKMTKNGIVVFDY